MRALRPVLVLLPLLGLLAGCGTPPEVKALSAAQITYLQKTTQAVQAQGQAVIDLTKLHQQALLKDAADQKAAAEAQALDFVEKYPSRRKDTLDNLTQTVTALAAETQTIQGLTTQAEATATKLQDAMARLIDVQKALDAYLASETAGEALLNSALGQPSAQALLATASTAVDDVLRFSTALKAQVSDIAAKGKTK